MTPEEMAARLKATETVEELDKLLETEFFESGEWVPVGNENNYGEVFSQQGRAIPAVVELLTNGSDATLRKLFEQSSYTDKQRFQSAIEAAEHFDTEGERIILRADGFTPNDNSGEEINLLVIDTGAGQSQEDFEDTFLELSSPGLDKQDYGFLQGQFGLGSTGVMPFTIAQDDKRAIKFVASASHEEPGKWSWSLIRHNIEEQQFEYFTVDGENAPKFEGTLNGMESGSVVKLYDYDLDKKSRITTESFRKRLNKYVTNFPFPITIEDARYDTTDDVDTSEFDYGLKHSEGSLNRKEIHGLKHKLDNSQRYQDGGTYGNPIEEKLVIEKQFDNEHLGTRNIHVYVFKDYLSMDDEELENFTNRQLDPVRGESHQRVAVMYTVNGQTHGREGTYFLRETCGLSNVGKTMLVFVPLDDLSYFWKCRMFGSSRNSLRKDENITKALRTGVEEALSSNPVLQEIEEERRVDISGESMDDSWAEDFKDFVERSSSTLDFLKTGEHSILQRGAKNEQRFDIETQDPPTRFELITHYNEDGVPQTWNPEEDGRDEYPVEIEEDSTRTLQFLLNAPDDYLSAGDGQLEVTPNENYESSTVSNGTFTLQIGKMDSFDVGQDHNTIVTVDAPDIDDPFEIKLRTKYVEATESPPPGPDGGPKEGDEDEEMGAALPNVIPVQEDEWERIGMTEEDIIDAEVAGDDLSDMTLRVNMDSAPRKEFFDEHDIKLKYKEKVERAYLNAVVLLSCCTFISLNDGLMAEALGEARITTAEAIESLVKDKGEAIFNIVISDLELDQYTEG